MKPRMWAFLLICLAAFSCQRQQHRPSTIFQQEAEDTSLVYDLDRIQEAGKLIAGTLSGPDTYYEYHGHGMGLEYLLADAFSLSIGARLQIEVAQDTTELERMLREGEIDFIALGNNTKCEKCPWKIGRNKPELLSAIEDWWNPSRKTEVLAVLDKRIKQQTKRNPRPKWRNREKGIISDYDQIFMRHGARIGWDWKLLAAQCYQESSFDPRAVSWAGAQGLMQIMPATAEHLSLRKEDVFTPEANIAAAVKYLDELMRAFDDITDRQERIDFVLASYNGGQHHVRDAMSLCRKHGEDETRWNNVSRWVENLQYARYYRDPCVKYGYMRGSETAGYVKSIHRHWNAYRGM